MFDREMRWFIRCDTCPDEPPNKTGGVWSDKDSARQQALDRGWDIRDDLHRCPRCVREGHTERVS